MVASGETCRLFDLQADFPTGDQADNSRLLMTLQAPPINDESMGFQLTFDGSFHEVPGTYACGAPGCSIICSIADQFRR